MMTSFWARMRTRWRPVVLSLVVAFTLLVILSPLLGPEPSVDSFAFAVLVGGSFLSVGCVVLIRAGWHRIGWLLAATGVMFAIGMSASSFLPSWYTAWTGTWSFTAAFALLACTTIVFPSGRLPAGTGLWTTVARAVVVALPVFVLLAALVRVSWGAESGVAISFGFLPSWMAAVGAAGASLSLLGGAVSLVVRFRRSAGEERAQLAWVVSSLALVAASVGATFAYLLVNNVLLGRPDPGDGVWSIAAIAYLTMPLAFMVAILRYRLYEIDRLISRTLTYVLLTAGLGATYVGLVAGLQTLLRPLSGGSDLAIVLTTLAVAALFLPARRRVQNAVDRRFNRRTYDAARTIEAFSVRLREQVDLDTLRYELLSVVDETMQPAKASLWLRNQEAPR